MLVPISIHLDIFSIFAKTNNYFFLMNKFSNYFDVIAKFLISNKFFIPFAALIIISIPMLLKDDIAFKNTITLFESKNTYILVIVIFTTLIISFVVKFLSDDLNRKNRYYMKTNDMNRLREIELKEMELDLMANNIINNNFDLHQLEKNIYKKIVEDFESTILRKTEEKLKNDLENRLLTAKIERELEPLVFNTENYIGTIQKNSIINLVIGIIGTITAITILAISILSDKNYNNLQDFAIHLLPRITFVIFIQLFAFFFLRLYKNNLEDGKYFQNELTNLSAKCSALKIAIFTNNMEKQSEILSNLSQVERNFKIQKEETLLNIEKAKIEKEYDLEILNTFKDFLKTYKKD